MTTIASPRPSLSLSSRRTSVSTDTTTTSTTKQPATATTTGSLRRNRAALRDYYSLKSAGAPSDTPPSAQGDQDVHHDSALDKADFNPTTYIQNLLTEKDLESIMRVEASLVGEIRSLDGEKKALVYDNYSKLIAATDTIRAMREKMDPLIEGKMMTGTLVPAVGHIASSAGELSGTIKGYEVSEGCGREKVERGEKEKQQETVRWVLGAPERLRRLIGKGKRDEAEREWKEVSGLLAKWKDVKGVDAVRLACEEVIKEPTND